MNELILDTSGVPRIFLNGKYIILASEKTQYLLYPSIQNILKEQNIEIKDLQSFIFCAGPGGYTNLRIAQGLAKIIQMSGVNIYSYYHHHLPRLMGKKKGIFFSWAYKNQVYLYLYDNDLYEEKLINQDQLENQLLENYETYKEIFSCSYLPQNSLVINRCVNLGIAQIQMTDLNLTHELILKDKKNMDLFYYRPVEGEFTRKKA